jgi:hypothetical protein
MNRRGEWVGQTIWVLQCRFLLMNFAMILQVQGLGSKLLFFSFLPLMALETTLVPTQVPRIVGTFVYQRQAHP